MPLLRKYQRGVREPVDCPLHFRQSTTAQAWLEEHQPNPSRTTETSGDATGERQCGTEGKKYILFSKEASVETKGLCAAEALCRQPLKSDASF